MKPHAVDGSIFFAIAIVECDSRNYPLFVLCLGWSHTMIAASNCRLIVFRMLFPPTGSSHRDVTNNFSSSLFALDCFVA